MYRNVFNTVPVLNKTIKDYVLCHKDRWLKYRDCIKAIRKLDPIADKANYNTLKEKLPGATVSGVFSKRNAESIITHSGYICIDIDKKDKINPMLNTAFERNELKEKLKHEPWVYAIMLSVGGAGLAVIVKIDHKRHLASYKGLEAYFMETYGVTTDDACTDVSRFRYISYDPDVYLNEEADEYKCEDNSFDFGSNKQKISSGDYFSLGQRDEDSFTVANCLIKAGQPQEFAEAAINHMASDWEDVIPNFAKIKVASAMKRHSDRNLSGEIKEWINATSGVFSATECYKELDIATKCNRSNARLIFSRLVKNEIIERVGSKNGQFRKRETELEAMNWQEEDTSLSYDLKLPLGLHNLIDFNPGNIVLLAGVKETGKTAFALTTALMNSHLDVRYFNSEMGKGELKKRLTGFPDTTKDSWNHITFYNRAYNHADVIFPDSLNIIDFLEIPASSGFYSVVDVIRGIHDKIVTGKGLVIICMQKAAGAEYARGGAFSAEKARVYFNLEYQEIEIKHCKSPKLHSVHGKKIGFILRNGNTFAEDEASYPFA